MVMGMTVVCYQTLFQVLTLMEWEKPKYVNDSEPDQPYHTSQTS